MNDKQKSKITQAILRRLLYVGSETPQIVTNNEVFILKGSPQEFLDEILKD